ncbi:MAG: chromosome segregation protein, partial [Elusimicrobia bacterium]
MYLKSIEILGFKSFADRTRIELKTGINGVIGPNGCGKSNIMEAIRWCIGEMSWKSLRSDSMVSVIFAGTARRAPMNLCEVTLTFDNAQSLLPVQYSEVQVARRLFRSGESEYYLNKTQCRLRDVRELFLDTGIGNDGYAIIDQGQVDFMVKSKPEERRALFEEAAGVAKYKAKRTEALRKLDRVEIDLGRLQDSLSLINEQIKKLDADARKAQLFKKYKEELGSLEAGSILREVGQLDAALSSERARLTPLAEQLAELKTRIGGDEARLAALNLERTSQQAQVIEVNGLISEAKIETAQLEERARSADVQTADTNVQLDEGRKRLVEDERRAETMAPVIESARQALEEASRRADAAKADLERFAAEFESFSAER